MKLIFGFSVLRPLKYRLDLSFRVQNSIATMKICLVVFMKKYRPFLRICILYIDTTQYPDR